MREEYKEETFMRWKKVLWEAWNNREEWKKGVKKKLILSLKLNKEEEFVLKHIKAKFFSNH